MTRLRTTYRVPMDAIGDSTRPFTVWKVNKNVQEFTSNLTRNTQQFQTESQVKLGEYQANIQNELNEFNKENAAYQAQLQVSVQNAQLENQDEQFKVQKSLGRALLFL